MQGTSLERCVENPPLKVERFKYHIRQDPEERGLLYQAIDYQQGHANRESTVHRCLNRLNSGIKKLRMESAKQGWSSLDKKDPG